MLDASPTDRFVTHGAVWVRAANMTEGNIDVEGGSIEGRKR